MIYPEYHRQYFDHIKTQLSQAPLTIPELTCLGHLIEQQLILERQQVHLFTVGNREREHLRHQFFVLNQVLELDAIQVGPLFAERDNGALKWRLYHRKKQVKAVLALSALDDSWGIEPFPIGDARRRIMTVKEVRDTNDLGNYSLRSALLKRGVDLEDLGGWKVPE
jgi:hypothetical protein